MKKFINHVDDFLAESLAGFASAHSDLVVLNNEPVYVRRKTLKPGKVALISGGGSGHEPLHSGFVGYGMLNAACPGQVFTSPTPDQMMAAADAVVRHAREQRLCTSGSRAVEVRNEHNADEHRHEQCEHHG